MLDLPVVEAGDADVFNRQQLVHRRAGAEDDADNPLNHSQPRGRPLRVLIVDDDRDACDALAAVVRRWGHSAREAYGGIQAFRAAMFEAPDVVLLNIDPPGLEGWRIARQLPSGVAGDRLMIASAMQVDGLLRAQCSEAGIDIVLVRPVDPEVLEMLLSLECELVNRLETGHWRRPPIAGPS